MVSRVRVVNCAFFAYGSLEILSLKIISGTMYVMDPNDKISNNQNIERKRHFLLSVHICPVIRDH